MDSSNGIFTHYKDSEGHFGVGKIPPHLQMKTQGLHALFFESIPKENLKNKTYHRWFKDFSPQLKEIVSEIQQDSFWKQVCSPHGTKCSVINVTEMDELYYSKAPTKKNKDLLKYGATSNFDPHIDGVFHFPGFHFYRILIGLTPNKTVETRFLKLNIHHKIQENDYIAFDFDNTKHQVVNHASEPSDDYRIMLKLHFLVCENCSEKSASFRAVKQMYILYEDFTRYMMQTGTDPKTFYQFFIGILCIFGNNYKGLSTLLLFSLFVLLPSSYLWKRNKLWQKRLLYFNLGWVTLLFLGTFALYSRYLITGLR